MGDMGDMYREMKQQRREHRAKYTEDCPGCPPNRNPTKLYPGQQCRVCGHRRPDKSI